MQHQTQPANPTSPKKKPDPFENPPSDLFITQIPEDSPTHLLILNKYPVIAQHFILATKPFKQQTDLLEEDDLAATFAVLKAWEDSEAQPSTSRKLFAFFNSGRHSGASQPHRHIQFLPVEEMAGGKDGQGWRLLSDDISSSEQLHSGSLDQQKIFKLPFVHFSSTIPRDPTPQDLYEIYMSLYARALGAVRQYTEAHPHDSLKIQADEGTSSLISYNLAITTSSMVICPRRKEGDILEQLDDSPESMIGPVALNGTILAGTLMVKSREEWNMLREDETKLYNLLQAIGLPS